MPSKVKRDKNGIYYQYELRRAKYYFNSESKRLIDIIYRKYMKQIIAIHARKSAVNY
jgi:hypothetical protein